MWNYAIETKEGFVLRKEKVYLLLRKERGEIQEFIEEQLRKEYIRLLKSPQMAPVFFVGKRDSKKRMVQDYWYLNKWIIKNNYPLLLISDIVKNIGTKKMFTKLDLRWKYNNIWIKEKDEQKAAFTTPKGLFELTIMFFGLTNSPAIFQTMKNKILWNLINTGKVVGFIDEIIVEFLNVVIGPEGIKLEEKKVKRLLDWLTSKEVKDIQKFLELANYY